MSKHSSNLIHWLLAHPATKGLDLDDPLLMLKRREILRGKVFLRRIYLDWYTRLTSDLNSKDAPVLELGSGAGFLQELFPDLVTSDVIHLPGLSAVLSAQSLPFKSRSLSAIILCNVLHHLPDVGLFFQEAARCMRTAGKIVMIEPWVTPWSQFIYKHLHHEDFDHDCLHWKLPAGGHLSGANGALPWMVFERDRERFELEHSEWRILDIDLLMPFLYILSGGISSRPFLPSWLFDPLKSIEDSLAPWNQKLAMFAFIKLVRV